MLTWLRVTSMSLHGAANPAVILHCCDPRPISIIEEAFSQYGLSLCHPVPQRCGARRRARRKPPGSERECYSPRARRLFHPLISTLGHSEKDQSCHNEVWVHLLHVNARLGDDRSRKLNLKERISPHEAQHRKKGGLAKNTTSTARGTGHPC